MSASYANGAASAEPPDDGLAGWTPVDSDGPSGERQLPGAMIEWYVYDGCATVYVDARDAAGGPRVFPDGKPQITFEGHPDDLPEMLQRAERAAETTIPGREIPNTASRAPWESLVTVAPKTWFTSKPSKRRWRLTDNRNAGAGVLPVGKVGLVIGEGGVSKTMVAIWFAIAVTTGTAWLGCYDVETQGRVLLLLGEEDAEEVQRRCYNVARATRTNPPPEGSIVVLPLAGVPCAMIEVDERGNPIDTAFLAWLRGYARSNDFAAIVIDPFSRFAGLDAETDNAAATRFVQACESLASSDTNVIVLHHTNKTARVNGASVTGVSARGSSAIYDGVRWAAALSAERVEIGEQPRADLSELVTLSIVKSNYSKKSDPVVLRRDAEHGGALLPLTAQEWEIVAAARETADPTSRRRAARDADREQRAAREAEAKERRAAERTAELSAKAAERAAAKLKQEAERAAKEAGRLEAEDAALRACVDADPGLNEGVLLSAMRARLGACGDRNARAAVERARLAGWLIVRVGAKNARTHHTLACPCPACLKEAAS